MPHQGQRLLRKSLPLMLPISNKLLLAASFVLGACSTTTNVQVRSGSSASYGSTTTYSSVSGGATSVGANHAIGVFAPVVPVAPVGVVTPTPGFAGSSGLYASASGPAALVIIGASLLVGLIDYFRWPHAPSNASEATPQNELWPFGRERWSSARSINEQDCTKPIERPEANLRCR